MATPAFPTSFVPGPLWGNGPTPGQVYNFPGAATAPDQWGTQRTLVEEECLNDGFSYTPPGLHSWLTRVMYNRRSQFNPLWNTYLVGGIHQEKPFLGYVDKIGIAYEADTIATGFGAYLALPILRDVVEKNKKMEEKQAVELIDRCMKLLFYRDARSLNKYQVAVVTKKGSEIRGPIVSEANWEIAHMVKGYE